MSSDEDDDLLNCLPTFTITKKKKKEDQKLNKFSDYLSQAFDKSDAQKESRAAAVAHSKHIHSLGEGNGNGNDDALNADGDADTSLGVKSENVAIDWDRLDSMVEEAEKSTELMQAKKKRSLLNSIDGIEEGDNCNSDAVDNSQDRIAIAGARATALSSGLGARRMLGIGQNDDSTRDVFKSFDDAMKDFRKRVRPKLKGDVKDIITKAEKNKAIPAMLYRRVLVKTCEASGEKNAIPKVFVQWLWKVLLSGSHCGFLCVDGARRTLKGLIELKIVCCVNFFLWDDFLPTLTMVFGYRKRPSNKIDNSIQQQEILANIDMMSFEGFLDVWNSIVINRLILISDEDTKISVLSSYLGDLSRIGLDPRFHVSSDNDFPCRRDVFQFVQELSVSILLDIISSDEDSKEDDLCSIVMNSILGSVCGLSSGLRTSEDSDDISGSLPIALTVRNFAVSRVNEPLVCRFMLLKIKAKLAIEAFRKCIGCKGSWEQSFTLCRNKLKVNDIFSGLESSRIMLSIDVIVGGITSLYELCKRSGELMEDSPRFYATIDLTSQMFLVGEHMLKLSTDDIHKDTDESKTNDVIITEFLKTVYSHAEDYCNISKKKIVNVFTKPHLRRSKEFFSTLGILFARMKEDMERLSNFKKTTQKPLSSYFEESNS